MKELSVYRGHAVQASIIHDLCTEKLHNKMLLHEYKELKYSE